ncbi:MAG: hypothetical protein RIR97_1269 [Pseudomonadota bacterium]
MTNDADGSARIRQAQIAMIGRYTPAILLINAMNAAITWWFVHESAEPFEMAVWLGAISLVSLLIGYSWLSARTRRARPLMSVGAIRSVTLCALVLSGIWAVVPMFWLSGLSEEARFGMGALITGMICAGGLILASVPTAALAFVTVLTFGGLIGMVQIFDAYLVPFDILLLVYCFVILRSVEHVGRNFIHRIAAETNLAERDEIIDLLLAEYDDTSTDWLFETDQTMVIVEHSARFGAAIGIDDRMLVGRSFLNMIHPDSHAALTAKLAKVAPFKGFDVRSADDGQTWWSITAKPVFDTSNQHIGWRGVGCDVTIKKKSERQLEQLAYFDSLTGLPNRTKFREQVEASIVATEQENQTLALLIVDLDQFKMVNDMLGHETGDELLQATAGILTKLAGKDSYCARLGNDEFGIILSEIDQIEHVEHVVRKIINAFQSPIQLKTGPVSICVSIGIVLLPEHGGNPDHLLRNADLALLKAKEIGGSGFVTFDHSLNDIFQNRAALARDLRLTASIEGQLEVWYQPQIDINSRTIAGFEALMRWKHPVRGYIPPSEFIPVAESSGLISDIGRWILKEAILQAQLWLKNTGYDIPVSVNLSVAQLWQSDLVQDVKDMIAESGLPPHLLCLEMTESMFVDYESGHVQRAIRDLKDIGVSLALDDFGTGYSSLSYLNQLPFDKLKIDRAFVTNCVAGKKERDLLQVIINLGKSLGMTVIAEGVETAEELDMLKEMGCPQIQGYFFGKPAPAPLALARAIERVTVMNLPHAPDLVQRAKSA